MATAREIMTEDPHIVSVDDSVRDCAKVLARQGIGGAVVCGPDRRLAGFITDRDLAVEVLAGGKDPDTTSVGDLMSGREVVTIGADDSIEEAMETMRTHAVRRLPVIDGTEVVGLLSQADLASAMGGAPVGEMVEGISTARDNTGRG